MRYVLLHPVTVRMSGPDGDREETVSEVMVRRVKGKDLRAVRALTSDVEVGLAMIERLTGLERIVVDEFDAVDIEGLGTIIEGFTVPGPPTGSASSAA